MSVDNHQWNLFFTSLVKDEKEFFLILNELETRWKIIEDTLIRAYTFSKDQETGNLLGNSVHKNKVRKKRKRESTTRSARLHGRGMRAAPWVREIKPIHARNFDKVMTSLRDR